jgi:tryptophan synthase alpha chain
MGETRLAAALRLRLEAGGRAFVPYVTGGLEGVDVDLLRAIEAAGADALEVGVPFTDPVIDGGVIQQASRLALERGFRLRDVFALVEEAALSIPVVLMTYLNPVVSVGSSRFIEMARSARVAGFIIPDLPVDEGGEWTGLCADAGLASVYLAAPDTPKGRLEQIAAASTGFVYCVSTHGVTGRRDSLSVNAQGLVAAFRPLTKHPLLVGVGISTVAQAAEAALFADGVIVGSALVEKLLDGDREGAIASAAAFRAALAGPGTVEPESGVL